MKKGEIEIMKGKGGLKGGVQVVKRRDRWRWRETRRQISFVLKLAQK
jgi:hypothetical protein